MLQRVTDRRLAEADRGVLHGVCHWIRLAKCGGYQYMYSFMGHCGNFEVSKNIHIRRLKARDTWRRYT